MPFAPLRKLLRSMLPAEHWGRGSVPVTFLHGFTGTGAAWRHLESALAETITATCIDLPGHGRALCPTSEGRQGFEEAVAEVAATIEKPTVLAGYSQGARIALALAIGYPHKVERLILEGANPGIRRPQARRARLQRDRTLAAFLEANGIEAFIDQWEHTPVLRTLATLPSDRRRELREMRASNSAGALAAALRAMGQGVQPDYWPQLSRIRVPVLLLNGTLDRKGAALHRKIATRLPLAWRATFPDVGHAPHLECPQAYASELRTFVTARWDGVDGDVVP